MGIFSKWFMRTCISLIEYMLKLEVSFLSNVIVLITKVFLKIFNRSNFLICNFIWKAIGILHLILYPLSYLTEIRKHPTATVNPVKN